MTVFAETPRLYLRSLEDDDLPRLVELIGDWEVTKWLVQVPFPYAIKDAEDFRMRMAECHKRGAAECLVIASRADNRIMGIVGLHPSREEPKTGEIVLGYWLGKPYWGQGFMTEAVQAAVTHAFGQPGIKSIHSTTDPANQASQNVLRKAGFECLGIHMRGETALRGGMEVTRWRLDNPRAAEN
jgi:RimJ/RimL family protein N-acetyltransferase